MIKRLEKIVFFLLIFFIPFQVGKHFWPSFSFISGVRVDYLSPTLYLTDILVAMLIVLVIIGRSLSLVFSPLRSLSRTSSLLVTLFILVLIFSSLTAQSPQSALYGCIKLIEMVFVGLYVASTFKRENMSHFVDVNTLSAFLVSGLALSQFVLQHSIGGIFYFLGERSFTALTPGIATIRTMSGLLLRPYASFPHPNVLAFYLLFVLTLIIFYIQKEKDKKEKIFLSVGILVFSLTLLLTFSRLTILYYLCILAYIGITKLSRKVMMGIVVVGVILILYISFYSTRFLHLNYLLTDTLYRTDLIQVSLQILQRNPFTGIGINNFYIHEIEYQKSITPTFLQPVHNIYILILVQLGSLGLVPVLMLIKNTFNNAVSKLKKEMEMSKPILLIFLGIIFLGLFDHFFITLQQGQLLTAIILGLAWQKERLN